MKIITPFNAINSWEGYEYQGHLALNVALINLYKLINNKNDFSKWELQIEGEEDFSILEDGNYKTVHQVKQGNLSLKPEDKFAFVIGILQNNAEHGYFHVNTSQRIPKNFLRTSLIHIKNLQGEFNKAVKLKRELLPSEKEDQYIIVERIRPQKEKASVYKILNYVCKEKKDLISVKIEVDNVKKTLTAFEFEINDKIAEYKLSNPTMHDDGCILSEWSEKYDNSKEVREKNVEIIKLIIDIEKPAWSFADLTYCEFVYDQLFSTLKKCITEFFIKKIQNGKCLIPFSKIYEEVLRNYIGEHETVGYKYYLIRRAITDLYNKFPVDTCKVIECKTCVEEASCNLKKQMDLFSSRKNEEKQKLLFNLLLENPKEMNNLPSNDLIKCQLLNILKAINRLSITEKNTICAKSAAGEFYWLSLDDSREQDILREKIQNGIKESEDKSFLYECDVLITDRLNKKYFKIDGSNVNILEEEQLCELKAISGVNINDEMANCNKPKVIRLVDGTEAKGVLVNE